MCASMAQTKVAYPTSYHGLKNVRKKRTRWIISSWVKTTRKQVSKSSHLQPDVLRMAQHSPREPRKVSAPAHPPRDGFSSEHPDIWSQVEHHTSCLQQQCLGKPFDINPKVPKEQCEVSQGCFQVSAMHEFPAKNLK